MIRKSHSREALINRRSERRLSELFIKSEKEFAPCVPVSPISSFKAKFETPTSSKHATHFSQFSLMFQEEVLEHKFLKHYYFGDGKMPYSRIAVLICEAVLTVQYALTANMSHAHFLLRFFIPIVYLLSAACIVLRCSWDPTFYRISYSTAKHVESTILITKMIVFTITNLHQLWFLYTDPILQIHIYFHIWTSLTMLRLRFFYAFLLSLYSIFSYLSVAVMSYGAYEVFDSSRIMARFFGLLCLIIYALTELYAVEKLMRKAFSSSRSESMKQEMVRIEKKKSQNLIQNLCPKFLIPELKEYKMRRMGLDALTLSGAKPIVHRSYNASVLISDIKSFTEFSGNHSAEEVLLILNIHFSYFDLLSRKLHVEKIKTIGDAFFAVGGLETADEQDSYRSLWKTLLMAIGILRLNDIFNRKFGWNFSLRIGVDYGLVIPCVMGSEYLTFDCFGTAVSTAQRLEELATPGTILTTKRVYDVSNKKFIFQPSGSVKFGDHEVQTYNIASSSPFTEKITDAIIDHELDEILHRILEQQNKYANESLTVRHESKTNSRNAEETKGLKKSPSIDRFSQSPLFTDDLASRDSTDVCDSPRAEENFGISHWLEFSDQLEEQKYHNYLDWKMLMCICLISHIAFGTLFSAIPIMLGRFDVVVNSFVMCVNYSTIITHIICVYLVMSGKTSYSYHHGIMISVLALGTTILSSLLFIFNDFTIAEIFPAAMATMIHMLAVPPNISFKLKLYLVALMDVLGSCICLYVLQANNMTTLFSMQSAAISGLFNNYLKEWALRNISRSTSLREASTDYLRKEKAINDQLILSFLVESSLQRVKQGETNIFENISDCTVCFVKVRGMDELLESVYDADMHTLKRVFSFIDLMIQRFDSKLKIHNCEKVKNIGSIFMLVSGLSHEISNHSEQMILLSFDLIDQLQKICEEYSSLLGQHTLSLQIGLHSGPVSGGILGYHRFLYDVFGDTVNLAARAMATSKECNQVHLSEEVFARIENVLPDYHLTYEKRGPVTLKGKGIVNMRYVKRSTNGRRVRIVFPSSVSC